MRDYPGSLFMQPSDRKYTIGRDRNCDVPIADDSVSRLHAEFMFAPPGMFILKDCGSSNGTVLVRDGTQKSLGQEQVFATDEIIFGSVKLSMRDVLDAI